MHAPARWSCVRPTTVVVALIGLMLPLLAPVHPIRETDRDCGPVTVGVERPTAQFVAVRPPVGDEHCPFCHWLRSVGGASPSAAVGRGARPVGQPPGAGRLATC